MGKQKPSRNERAFVFAVRYAPAGAGGGVSSKVRIGSGLLVGCRAMEIFLMHPAEQRFAAGAADADADA